MRAVRPRRRRLHPSRTRRRAHGRTAGSSSSGMSSDKRKYTARHESRTVRDGAHAVHVGKPGGLQSVGKRRSSADAARAARTANVEVVLDQPLVYTQSNGTIELRSLIADALSRRDSRPRAGHQRRLRSQLHRRLAAHRAGRRGGPARAQLHADLGARARVRRHRSRVARSSKIARRAAGGPISTSCGASSRTRPASSSSAHRIIRPARGSRADELDEIAAHRRDDTAPGCCPTRCIAAPSSTVTRRRRCGAATIA